jgi:hypothetical protein
MGVALNGSRNVGLCPAQSEISTKFAKAHTLEFFTTFAQVYEGQRFDLRFLRPLRADLSIKKSSSFFPPLMTATSQ